MAGIQGVLTLEVITIVNVFLDTKVMVSHVAKKMPVPMEVTIVIHMLIVSAKRTKKGKVSTTFNCKEGFDDNGKKMPRY